MADERKSGPPQENRSAGQDKGGQRRYFWRKKRGQKAAGEENTTKEQPAAQQPGAQRRAAPKAANNDKGGDRDPRAKRRRRRPRSRQGLSPEPKTAAPVTPLADNYVPPASIFIYTHVVRPDQRDNYEFRADHFSKVSRRLEDFDLDLSKLFPEDRANMSPEQIAALTPPEVDWEGTEFDERDSSVHDK
ncbi:MAG: hypothetical protein NT075_19360 [Chloroflexi bacterium]|nr:hypothetical protein [Chloroflexota bacterium]